MAIGEILVRMDEIDFATRVGAAWGLYSIKNGLKGAYGLDQKRDGWEANMVGAIGEMVLAKYLGMYWEIGVGDTSFGDVGDIEVRSTRLPSGSLIIHKGDRGPAVYVLVIGPLDGVVEVTDDRGGKHPAMRFRIPGAVRARDIQALGFDHKWWTDKNTGRGFNWYVPQSGLEAVEEFGLFPRFRFSGVNDEKSRDPEGSGV